MARIHPVKGGGSVFTVRGIGLVLVCTGMGLGDVAGGQQATAEVKEWSNASVESLAEDVADRVDAAKASPMGGGTDEETIARLQGIESELALAAQELRTLASLVRAGADREATRPLFEKIQQRAGRVARLAEGLEDVPSPQAFDAAHESLDELAHYYRAGP
jgi:hypothetical protein